MENQMTRIFATLAAVLIASPLSAGHCVQRQVIVNHGGYYGHQKAIAIQQYYQPYVYGVGQNYREEAVAERIARKVEAKLTKRFEQLRTPVEHPAVNLLVQHCAGCHKPGTKAVVEDDAPVFFSDASVLKPLNDAQKKKFEKSIRLGTMPKNGEPLSDADDVTIRNYLFPNGLPEEGEPK
jgi:cytochrome c553